MLTARYRLDERISAGPSSEVWRGTDVILARQVAVQILSAGAALDPRVLAWLREKARHTASVTHLGVAKVYDYDERAPSCPPFLVMEWVDGQSLAGVLAGGPMRPARAMDIVAQTAAALHAAHQAGLVHRGLSPDTVLLSRGGIVKLTDFASPRELAGRPDGNDGDLYALGILARRCLTGAAADPADEAALPETIPPDVAALIGELTAEDPGRRPGDAGQVARRARELHQRLIVGDLAEAAGDAGVHPEQAADGAEERRKAGTPPAGVVPPAMLAAAGAGHPAKAAAGNGSAAAGEHTQPLRRVGHERRYRRPLLALVAVAAVALPFALPRVLAPGSRPPPAAAANVVTVDINGAALKGRQVAAVQTWLRRMGLRVTVRWRHSREVAPGRVISVSPSGRMPAGSTVVVTGALRPVSTGGTGATPETGGSQPGAEQPGTGQPSGPPHRRHHHSHGGPTPAPSPTQTGTPSPAPTGSPSPTGTPSTTPSGNPTGAPSSTPPGPSMSPQMPESPQSPQSPQPPDTPPGTGVSVLANGER